MAAHTDRSIYFDDFAEGQVYEKKEGREVTAELIRKFSEASGDFNPLHLDAEYAKTTPFGRNIAHGLLGLSMASGFLHDMGIVERSIVAFATLEWKFRAPAFIGDKLHCRMEVTRKRGLKKQGLVVFKSQLLNQEDKVIQEGVWSLMIQKKPE